MKIIISIVLCLHCSVFLFAQKTDKKLQAKITEAIKGFNGDIGIYVKNLRTGKISFHQCRYYFSNSKYCKSSDTDWCDG